MEDRRSPLLVKALLLVGGVICLGWTVVSIRALIDSATEAETISRVFRAIGPLGVILVVLAIVLDPRRRRADR